MPKFAVILPAAGKSSRFQNQKRKKPFIELHGRAVWIRAVEHFVTRDDVVQTILVISPEDKEFVREKFLANIAFMGIELVEGGEERFLSVEKALEKVVPEAEYIAIHDAARPLIVSEWIDQVFQAAVKRGAAIPAIPVANTLKRVGPDGLIVETVSREGLWQAQTPQVFRRDLLEEAFRRRGDLLPTDEAQLVEQLGHHVTVIEGSPMNFKITSPQDFRFAESVVDALPKPKILGNLHPFAEDWN